MDKNLATTTTLAALKAIIRDRTGTLDVQDSELIDTTMTNLVHQAIMTVRTLAGPFLDLAYNTDTTVTAEVTSKAIDISAFDIADVNVISLYGCLYDVVHGPIPIYGLSQFNAECKSYANNPTALFATITNMVVTGNDKVLAIKLFVGSGVALGTLTFTYPRNPRKVVIETDLIDIPERYVQTVADIAAIMVCEKFGKEPRASVTARASALMQSMVQQATFEQPSKGRKIA